MTWHACTVRWLGDDVGGLIGWLVGRPAQRVKMSLLLSTVPQLTYTIESKSESAAFYENPSAYKILRCITTPVSNQLEHSCLCRMLTSISSQIEHSATDVDVQKMRLANGIQVFLQPWQWTQDWTLACSSVRLMHSRPLSSAVVKL